MQGMKRAHGIVGWLALVWAVARAPIAAASEKVDRPDGSVASAETLPDLPLRQVERIRRTHKAGVVGSVMVPSGALLLFGGVRAFDAAWGYDRTFDRWVVEQRGLARLGVGMMVVGGLAAAGGEATVLVSTVGNAHRLHRIDGTHSRTAGWLALAAVPTTGLIGASDVGSRVGGALTVVGFGGLLAGQTVQLVQNARTARGLGVLDGPAGRVSAVRVRPMVDGVQVVGRF